MYLTKKNSFLLPKYKNQDIRDLSIKKFIFLNVHLVQLNEWTFLKECHSEKGGEKLSKEAEEKK